MNLRRLSKRFLAVAVGLVVAALVAELLVLLVLGEQPKFPRHVVGAEWGLRINQPDAEYRHKSADVNVRFAINARGLRAERDYPYAKPADVRRIVVLGDSFTVGYEVAFEECFASVMESRLNAAGARVEVLNAGVSGFSNAEECLYLERELVKYEPDVVLLAFFENDYADNVRTGLFALEDGVLKERATEYIPAGGFADFLNRNALFSVLSERSNAFAYLKERATLALKRRMVAKQAAEANDAPAQANVATVDPLDAAAAERALCAAILERIHRFTHERGIELVLMSIPFPADDHVTQLVDRFPAAEFPLERDGLTFVAARDVLQPHAANELLYWTRSHNHWTPFAHARAGEELARTILERRLLD